MVGGGRYVFAGASCNTNTLDSCYYKTLLINIGHFDVWLTVYLSVTLANDQLDAQFLYFIIRLL